VSRRRSSSRASCDTARSISQCKRENLASVEQFLDTIASALQRGATVVSADSDFQRMAAAVDLDVDDWTRR